MRVADLPTVKEMEVLHWRTRIKKRRTGIKKRRTVMMGMRAEKKKTRLGQQQ